MTTPASLREAPTRNIDDYILVKEYNAGGLSAVPWNRFQKFVTNSAAGSWLGQVSGGGEYSLAGNTYSQKTPIGFTFEFNGEKYSNFLVTNAGVAILINDKNTLSNPRYSNIASPSTLVNIALMVWYPGDVNSAINTYDTILSSYPTVDVSGTPIVADNIYIEDKKSIQPIYNGLIAKPNYWNPEYHGVHYCYDSHSSFGKRLLIRWNTYTNDAPRYGFGVITYECAIYENGIIEYRYTTNSNLNSTPTSEIVGETQTQVSVGVWLVTYEYHRVVHVNGIPQFRDFSIEFGVDQFRKRYKYGGTVYDQLNAIYNQDAGYRTGIDYYYDGNSATQITTNIPWNKNVDYITNWPGTSKSGMVLKFIPPCNRRKILPRKQIKLIDQLSTNNHGPFNDLRTLNYDQNIVVNYPTTLQRFYGNGEKNIQLDQNLYTGDFELTGSVTKAATDEFINDWSNLYDTVQPFNDMGSKYVGSWGSGSFIDTTTQFSLPLSSKEKIELKFPINTKISLLSNTASIYYYNKETQTFNWPINDLTSSIVSPYYANTITNNRCEAKGYSFLGTSHISSSQYFADNNELVTVLTSTTTNKIGAKIFNNLIKYHDNSIFQNQKFNATNSEQITVNLDHPFLVEKALIQVPIEAGKKWFFDGTCFGCRTNSGSVGMSSNQHQYLAGGPAVTVSLMNQIGDQFKTRELILKGTFTHSNDINKNAIILEQSGSEAQPGYATISATGLKSFGIDPEGVVQNDGSNQFTGSVNLFCTSKIDNGCIVSNMFNLASTTKTNSSAEKQFSTVNSLINNVDSFNLNENNVTQLFDGEIQQTKIANVYAYSSIGRSKAGIGLYKNQYAQNSTIMGDFNLYSPTGGDLALNENVIKHYKLTNNLYSSSINLSVPTTSSAYNNVYYTMATYAGTDRAAPYILYPNDKLIIGISKYRPAIAGPVTGLSGSATFVRYINDLNSEFSGTITEHDIKIGKGDISITLFGTYLSNDKQTFIPSQTQNNGYVSTIIGDEPVIDQFELINKFTYVGSGYDNYIRHPVIDEKLRDQMNPDPAMALSANRGLVFRDTDPTFDSWIPGQPPEIYGGMNARDASYSPAYRAQPNWQRARNCRNTVMSYNYDERLYDSCYPSISQIAKFDGAKIGVRSGWSPLNDYIDDNDKKYSAHIFFDITSASDNQFTKSFIFDRYSSFGRILSIKQNLIAFWDFNLNAEIQPINVQKLYVWFTGTNPFNTTYGAVKIDEYVNSVNGIQNYDDSITIVPIDKSDAELSGIQTIMSASATETDTLKCLYGYGDMQLHSAKYSTTTHFPNFQRLEKFYSYSSAGGNAISYAGLSPIIRGWKYGLISALPTYSRVHFRRGKFGQFRDLLEFQNSVSYINPNKKNSSQNSPIQIKFFDTNGKETLAENTWSSNLSMYATSSLPFFDGIARNRNDINVNIMNIGTVNVSSTKYGQLTI